MEVFRPTPTKSRGSSEIATTMAPNAETWEVIQIANARIKMRKSSWTKRLLYQLGSTNSSSASRHMISSAFAVTEMIKLVNRSIMRSLILCLKQRKSGSTQILANVIRL